MIRATANKTFDKEVFHISSEEDLKSRLDFNLDVQTLSAFSVRRLPAVTAPSWCGLLRSRYITVSAAHTQRFHKHNFTFLCAVRLSDADLLFVHSDSVDQAAAPAEDQRRQ